jgi:hypothetical protein
MPRILRLPIVYILLGDGIRVAVWQTERTFSNNIKLNSKQSSAWQDLPTCQSVPPFPLSEPLYTLVSAAPPVETHSPPGEPVSRIKLYYPVDLAANYEEEDGLYTYPGAFDWCDGPDCFSSCDDSQNVRNAVLTRKLPVLDVCVMAWNVQSISSLFIGPEEAETCLPKIQSADPTRIHD